jgi:hypothetical protein
MAVSSVSGFMGTALEAGPDSAGWFRGSGIPTDAARPTRPKRWKRVSASLHPFTLPKRASTHLLSLFSSQIHTKIMPMSAPVQDRASLYTQSCH